jgi:plastocyanin
MVIFAKTFSAVTAILGFASTAFSAAPQTGVIHRIFAGSKTANNGLHFEPENVVADIGDIVEVHFLPKNHTMTQASFDKPCEPLTGGVFSGFNFATPVGESQDVFTFTIKDKEPFWYYCSQTVGNHCQSGMSGVINQNFNSPDTLTAFKARAVGTITKQPSTNKCDFGGGTILPNKSL